MAHYAKHNTRADLDSGNHGFLNTWEISRFDTKAERDQFVDANSNQKATAITRNQAGVAFAATFICVGEKPPVGGLFAENKYGDTNFWNERQPA